MPVDINGYFAAMRDLIGDAQEAAGQAAKRNDIRQTMQGLGQPLSAQQVQALLADQLADTQALQALLDAAIVAIDPNQ